MKECSLSGDLRVFAHHIYELEKGLRRLVLCTLSKNDESYVLQRLEKHNLEHIVYPVGLNKINVFFGRRECIDVIRLICTRPLNELTPEEDFMLGVLLGYDLSMQCERFEVRKTAKKIA